MKNKFNVGKEISDEIRSQTYWEIRGRTWNQTSDRIHEQIQNQTWSQTSDQTYWQITSQIKEAVND